MSITVTPEAEAKIREKVANGRYASANDVISKALLVLDWQERQQEKLERLRELIDEGMEGPFTPLSDEMKAESWERAKRRARAGEKPRPDAMVVDETI